MANGEDGIGLLFGGDINARDTDENAAANATSRENLAMVVLMFVVGEREKKDAHCVSEYRTYDHEYDM